MIGDFGFERVIAIGAYFHDPAKNLAELAFSVLKEWQGRGLSSAILKILAKAARGNGIAGLIAYTQPQNQGMIKLFHRLPYKIQTGFEDEMLVLSCRFDEPASG
jgi:L-amino acid N-acyltransferase YncA